MATTILHNYSLLKSGYMCRAFKVNGKRMHAYEHREVWEAAHGPIPPGHHIHHKNKNRRDNRLENLECVEARAHLRSHGMEPTMVRHLASQREAWEPRALDCPACDKVFITKSPVARFCSHVCTVKYSNWLNDAKKAARRLEARKDRECPTCKKVFTPKDAKGTHCSKACLTAAYCAADKEARRIVRGDGICVECGAVFVKEHKANQKYCTPRCCHIVLNREYRARQKEKAHA